MREALRVQLLMQLPGLAPGLALQRHHVWLMALVWPAPVLWARAGQVQVQGWDLVG